MFEFFGTVATTFIILGRIGIAHKNRCGFWLTGIGNVIWGIAGMVIWSPSLIITGAIIGATDIYGLFKWRKIT